MPAKYISELENKVSVLVAEAHNRKNNAKQSKAKYYFDGQSDAFNQVLIELKNLKYALEAHIDDEEKEEARESGEEVKVKRRRRKKNVEKVESPEEKYPEQAALLKEAKERGVIEQKSSHYFYEGFEGGKIQGKMNILQELAKEEIAQKIRERFAQ